MSKLCALKRTSLNALNPMYLKFTSQPGVLRALRVGESLEEAQGLNFNCPHCEKGITLLFDLDSVPPKASPAGRYNPFGDGAEAMPKLSNLTIVGRVRAPYCTWTGWVTKGELFWKPLP